VVTRILRFRHERSVALATAYALRHVGKFSRGFLALCVAPLACCFWLAVLGLTARRKHLRSGAYPLTALGGGWESRSRAVGASYRLALLGSVAESLAALRLWYRRMRTTAVMGVLPRHGLPPLDFVTASGFAPAWLADGEGHHEPIWSHPTSHRFLSFPVPFLLGFAIEYREHWTAYVAYAAIVVLVLLAVGRLVLRRRR
jgi:hypothetical protein